MPETQRRIAFDRTTDEHRLGFGCQIAHCGSVCRSPSHWAGSERRQASRRRCARRRRSRSPERRLEQIDVGQQKRTRPHPVRCRRHEVLRIFRLRHRTIMARLGAAIGLYYCGPVVDARTSGSLWRSVRGLPDFWRLLGCGRPVSSGRTVRAGGWRPAVQPGRAASPGRLLKRSRSCCCRTRCSGRSPARCAGPLGSPQRADRGERRPAWRRSSRWVSCSPSAPATCSPCCARAGRERLQPVRHFQLLRRATARRSARRGRDDELGGHRDGATAAFPRRELHALSALARRRGATPAPQRSSCWFAIPVAIAFRLSFRFRPHVLGP